MYLHYLMSLSLHFTIELLVYVKPLIDI